MKIKHMDYKRINNNAEKTAQAIIDVIGKRRASILDLVKWIEENYGRGVQVISLDLSNKICSGLVYPSKNYYEIWVDKNDPPERQHFTLCHELGHIVKDCNLSYGFFQEDAHTAKGTERFCNRFAAAFLMPAKEFISKWNNLSHPFLLKKYSVAKHFKVSKEAVHYRAKELGLNLE